MKRRNFFALLFGSFAAATAAVLHRKPKSALDSPWETQSALWEDVRAGRPVLHRRFKIKILPIIPDSIKITAPIQHCIFDADKAYGFIYRVPTAEMERWNEQMALAA